MAMSAITVVVAERFWTELLVGRRGQQGGDAGPGQLGRHRQALAGRACPGGQAAAMAAWDAGTVAAWAKDSAMGSTTRTGIERITRRPR